MPKKDDFVSVNVSAKLHRELKIASAHRGESMAVIIQQAWDAFKAKEGKNLQKPAPRGNEEEMVRA